MAPRTLVRAVEAQAPRRTRERVRTHLHGRGRLHGRQLLFVRTGASNGLHSAAEQPKPSPGGDRPKEGRRCLSSSPTPCSSSSASSTAAYERGDRLPARHRWVRRVARENPELFAVEYAPEPVDLSWLAGLEDDSELRYRNLLRTREAEKARQERARRDELEAGRTAARARAPLRKAGSRRSVRNRREKTSSGRSSNERSSSPPATTANH